MKKAMAPRRKSNTLSNVGNRVAEPKKTERNFKKRSAFEADLDLTPKTAGSAALNDSDVENAGGSKKPQDSGTVEVVSSSSGSSGIVASDEVAVLERTDAQSVSSSRSSSPLPEGEYEVEEIRDYNGDQYEVKWKGYEESENTWEPVENLLACMDKLCAFYLKRKEEVRDEASNFQGEKRQKRSKKAIPPDPRPLETIISEFFERENVAPTMEELEQAAFAAPKEQSAKKRDQWAESKLRKYLEDASNKKFTSEQLSTLRSQAVHFQAEILAKVNEAKLRKWEKYMNNVSRGLPKITVENKADLTGPPEGFIYINNYLPAAGIVIPDDPPMGCACEDDCSGSGTTKECCPQLASTNKGYYSSTKKLKVSSGTPIYECNKKCGCSEKCTNRVVQDGVLPLKDMKFRVFRTDNSRGWGVKTSNAIRKGTFVCLYVGEIITTEEAERRGRLYDQEGITYLFDLDFNETDGEECPYVVDAAKYGNISHFINHSCDPNLAVFGVWSDCLDPNLPKLALFAVRDIPKGTELTFDYKKGAEPRAASDTDKSNLPLIKQKECLCGSANCRKYFF